MEEERVEAVNQPEGSVKSKTTEKKDTSMWVRIAAILWEVVMTLKVIGAPATDSTKVRKFVETIFAISSRGKYQSSVEVNGSTYSIQDYQLASFLKFLVPVRSVRFDEKDETLPDQMIHDKASVKMDPEEFALVSYALSQVLTKHKPSMVSLKDCLVDKQLGSAGSYVVTDGSCVHADNVVTANTLPVRLKYGSEMFGKFYFSYPLDQYLRHLVLEQLSNANSKSNE